MPRDSEKPMPLLLIIDDEPDICFVLAKILTRLGYATLTATTAFEAVEIYVAQSASITGVFIDLTMPDVDGYHTLALLRNINPTIKVVMMSGYDVSNDTNYHADEYIAFLHKPFLMQELTTILTAFSL